MAQALGHSRHSHAGEQVRLRWTLWIAITAVLVVAGLFFFSLQTTGSLSATVMAVRDGMYFGVSELGAAWDGFLAWTTDHYQRVPTLMLGLAVLALLPVLAMVSGLLSLVRRPSWNSEATRRLKRSRRAPQSATNRHADFERAAQQPPWPMQAWLEVEGHTQHFAMGSDIVQIGRDVDTDVCLADPTVHRYHAAIHKSEDGPYIITDLSAPYGNGVFINGGRVTAAVLRPGDQIHIGKRLMKFLARPM